MRNDRNAGRKHLFKDSDIRSMIEMLKKGSSIVEYEY